MTKHPQNIYISQSNTKQTQLRYGSWMSRETKPNVQSSWVKLFFEIPKMDLRIATQQVQMSQYSNSDFQELVPLYMGVSKNRGTPKWMVYNGKPY